VVGVNDVREFAARVIVHGAATGIALVSPDPISFLGDLDIRTGDVVNTTSAVRGQNVAGKVLVMPYGVGSAGAWRFLYQMYVHKTNPVAIISQALPDSSLVQGAILSHVPIVCHPAVDLFGAINSGDEVEIDTTRALVRVRAQLEGGAHAVT
jgi:predicted aconitase with swiveling domain